MPPPLQRFPLGPRVRLRRRPVAHAMACALAVLGALTLWLRALTICPQCAHEQADAANFCTHCGAALRAGGISPVRPQEGGPAGTAGDVPSGSPAGTSSGPLADLVSGAVVADVQLGREWLASGRPDVARAVFANALAVSAADPTALTPQQGERLLAELRQCEQLMTQASVPCPTCQGTGKRSLRFESLTGETATMTAGGQACPACNGSGSVRRNRSADDMKYVVGQARQQAEQALRSRGRVPVGGAWVPVGLVPLLDDATGARLRKAAAPPCVACQGLGRTDCKKCGNTGFVPCTAKGCDQGWVVREELNQLDERTALKRRERCAACGGSARVACPDCHGVGSLTCKACNGTGKAPACTACGGEGLAPCRACRGEGKKRDGSVCAECGGDGVALCPSCRGDGTRSR